MHKAELLESKYIEFQNYANYKNCDYNHKINIFLKLFVIRFVTSE